MANPYTYTGYDATESARLASLWVAATAKTFWKSPAFGLSPNPLPAAFAAWGEVSERAIQRLTVKPDWGITSVVSGGRDCLVSVETVRKLPFGRLLEFKVKRPAKSRPKVMLIAPMSGHYATLLRNTVISLLPDCDVLITEWRNARNVPVSQGKFDVEDFTKHLVDFFKVSGPQTHVIAVCQPVPLTLAAVGWLAEHEPAAQPASMTLIGGPVDPDANRTEVTDFGSRVTMGQLEHSVIQTVGVNYPGVGRKVYPGSMQLFSFMAMNWDKHAKAFANQIIRTVRGEAGDLDRHNTFYDEYLAVMDMPAEFYLSTVERVFKGREIARNDFAIDGKKVDMRKITSVPTKIVEGGRDDISAPGQCAAALKVLSGLPDEMKAHHLEPDAGHYGIFSGKAWHENIRPVVLEFIGKHS
ncbi:MAG: polyhydroxyalkanoate depolymerase [Phyllobacteriaceae bacterium]|nr:polyhydroxyalkanoate depolymerase [Phyllobacteriaceae bacterium]